MRLLLFAGVAMAVTWDKLRVAPPRAWRLALVTLVLPVTVNVSEPAAINAPPVIVSPPLSDESAATDKEPPVIEIGSVLEMEFTD
jgi:hypothetical protein